jgi:hypothetical protein
MELTKLRIGSILEHHECYVGIVMLRAAIG